MSVEVVKVANIPGQYAGRKRAFDRATDVYDALARLDGLPDDEAVRFDTIDSKRSNLHGIIKQAAERRSMVVGVRITEIWTYIWRKPEPAPVCMGDA